MSTHRGAIIREKGKYDRRVDIISAPFSDANDGSYSHGVPCVCLREDGSMCKRPLGKIAG